MMAVDLVFGSVSLVFGVILAVLLLLVYVKAGFRGPILVVCLMPGLYNVFGSWVVFTLIPLSYDTVSNPALTPMVVNAVLGFVFAVLPLLLLAVLKWPVLNNSRDKVEVFQ